MSVLIRAIAWTIFGGLVLGAAAQDQSITFPITSVPAERSVYESIAINELQQLNENLRNIQEDLRRAQLEEMSRPSEEERLKKQAELDALIRRNLEASRDFLSSIVNSPKSKQSNTPSVERNKPESAPDFLGFLQSKIEAYDAEANRILKVHGDSWSDAEKDPAFQKARQASRVVSSLYTEWNNREMAAAGFKIYGDPADPLSHYSDEEISAMAAKLRQPRSDAEKRQSRERLRQLLDRVGSEGQAPRNTE